MLRRFVQPSRVAMFTAAFTTAVKQHVTAELSKAGMFSPAAIEQLQEEFYTMGFEKSTYQSHFGPAAIAEHVKGYMLAKAEGKADPSYTFEQSGEGAHAFYISNDKSAKDISRKIDSFVVANAGLLRKNAASVRGYTARNGITLHCVSFHPFNNATPADGATDLQSLTTKAFFDSRSAPAQKRYGDILERLNGTFTPVFDVRPLDDGTTQVTIAMQPDRTVYFHALSTLLEKVPNVKVTKRFLETFSNGAQVYTLYATGASVKELEAAASLIGQMPHRPSNVLTGLYERGAITELENIYGNAVSMFAYYFAPPAENGNFTELVKSTAEEGKLKRLKAFRMDMFREIMSESHIMELLASNVPLFKSLYNDFQVGSTPESRKLLAARIDKEIPARLNPNENNFFHHVLSFNQAVVKTNFFKARKSAVAFRLNPSFIGKLDFPRVPYGIFLVVGSQFRGFHVRFHDIARGGIRMIISEDEAAYKRNKRTLFQENYNLAHTQMLKNKDIPESGSKGTILVSTRSGTRTTIRSLTKEVLFKQYIDSLLDVMLENVEGVIDKLGKPEVLFFGPDENTAGDFPVKAAFLSRDRGYKQWKSLTTGKGQLVGGVPHDTYGMTTITVRTFVKGLYEKLKLKEEELTKFITGGPDGDLGSNEIKMGKEKIIGIADGSGVIHDPEGLNREELLRLATDRKMIYKFDRTKLGPRGFMVLVADQNVTLPDGTVVADGAEFRNNFHFTTYSRADVFVPCGGRPNAVTIDNVHQFLVDAPQLTGTLMQALPEALPASQLKYKIIVEGANLFCTQDARLALEAAGVQYFKDSSANKGGVTSSSIEVFTGMALDDAQHAELMCAKSELLVDRPAFYIEMAEAIKARLALNARKEFDVIWRDSQAGHEKGSKTLISDCLSRKIVQMRELIAASTLHEDKVLFAHVISNYTPKVLLAKVPFEVLAQRVPMNYLRAIFEVAIASDYVYFAGMQANEFAFFQYMQRLMNEAHKGK